MEGRIGVTGNLVDTVYNKVMGKRSLNTSRRSNNRGMKYYWQYHCQSHDKNVKNYIILLQQGEETDQFFKSDKKKY